MRFAVRALTLDNRMESLAVDGVDAAEVRRTVEARGWQAVSVVAQGRSGSAERGPRFSLLEFSQALVSLLEAGLTIVEALEGLLEKEGRVAARSVYERLLSRLREGQRFSSALRADGATFDTLFVGVVQAAEGTSDLPRALSRYVEHGSRLQALRGRVVSACVYPAILLAVGGGVALFLMGYVVPRFALVYQDAGRPLPWASRLLLECGLWLSQHAGGAASLCAIGAVGAVVTARRAWRSGRLLSAMSRLPWVGERLRVAELSRVYLTLGMLLEGGIPVVQALSMLRDSAPPTRARQWAAAAQAVSAGAPVSQAFEQTGLTTPIALRLLRLGERSGGLGPMLSRAALFHEDETTRWIERFSRAFEPALMALIGLLVGAIVVLLYLPIFDLAASFG